MKRPNSGGKDSPLRTERLQRHWSQREFAEHLGATVATVKRWERQVTTPSPYFRLKLTALFGKSEDMLGLKQKAQSPISHHESYEQLPPPASPRADNDDVSPFLEDPNLPTLLSGRTILVGRQRMLNQLVTDLCTKQYPSYALFGLPGIGKTTLAIVLAHHPQIRQHFPDGVLWVGLGPTPQISEALSHWGSLLGVSSNELQTLTTVDSLARSLRHRLTHRRMLLILDDVWELADAVSLHIGGVHCVHLLSTRFPPLAHAFAQEQATQVHPLSEDESISLLQQLTPRAWQAHPQDLHALAQTIDGHPLALTLIGRFLHRQSLNNSPRRLLSSLHHLKQDMQARFQLTEPLVSWATTPAYPVGTALSLQIALETSVHQLTVSAQSMLRALAIFLPKPYAFSEEAACAVCAESLHTLDLLMDSGLVETSQTGRYYLHQTVADYARLQPIDRQVEERLVAYTVTFIIDHAQEDATLEQDLPMITMAFEIASTQKLYNLLLQGVFALQPFLMRKLLYTVAEKCLNFAHEAALALNNPEALVRQWMFRGMLAWKRGDAQQAQQAYVQGLALVNTITCAKDLHVQLLVHIGETLVDTELGCQAETYLLEAWSLLEDSDEQTSLCEILRSLGELAGRLGERTKELQFFEHGLAVALQTQQWENAAALLQNLGVEAYLSGAFEQADAYYQRAMVYAQQQKDVQRQSALLMNQGMLAWQQHQQEKALALSQESLQYARQVEHQMRISSVLQNLGMMMRVLGRYPEAMTCLQESLERARNIGHCWLTCETMYELGMLSLLQGYVTKARQIFADVYQQAQMLQAPFLLGLALFGRAQVAERESQRARALQNAQESQQIFEELKNVVWCQNIEGWYKASVFNHEEHG